MSERRRQGMAGSRAAHAAVTVDAAGRTLPIAWWWPAHGVEGVGEDLSRAVLTAGGCPVGPIVSGTAVARD